MRGKGFIYKLTGREMEGQDVKMEEREAHGLCFSRANRGVTLVTRRMSVRGWDKGWSKGVMREDECVRGM